MTTPRGKVHTFGVDRRRPAEGLHAAAAPSAYERAYSTERTLDSTKLPERRRAGHGLRRGRPADVGEPRAEQAHVRLRRRAGPLRHGHARARRRRGQAGASSTPTTASCPRASSSRARRPGRYDYTLGDRILPTSEKLTVGATEITRALEFDDDRLATKTGPFSIERNGPAGAVSKITDGKLALTYAYDANGRPGDAHAEPSAARERFFQKLTFDNAGRASAREERVDGGAPTRSPTATTAAASC